MQGETVPAAPIDRDAPCIACGYNLRGLSADANCPECGHAIADSLRGDRLAFADPRWLSRVRAGWFVLAVAWLLGLLWDVGQPMVVSYFAPNSPGWTSYLFLVCSVRALITAAELAGVWLATAREPRLGESDRGDRMRYAARAGPIAGLASVAVVLGLYSVASAVSGTPRSLTPQFSGILAATFGVTGTVGIIAWVALTIWAHRFAARAKRPVLAGATRAAMVGVTAAYLLWLVLVVYLQLELASGRNPGGSVPWFFSGLTLLRGVMSLLSLAVIVLWLRYARLFGLALRGLEVPRRVAARRAALE